MTATRYVLTYQGHEVGGPCDFASEAALASALLDAPDSVEIVPVHADARASVSAHAAAHQAAALIRQQEVGE